MNLFRFGANLRLIPETSKLFLYFRIQEDEINCPSPFGGFIDDRRLPSFKPPAGLNR